MNVALFKTNHLGDNIVFVPAIQALRRLRPAWRLTLITAPQVVPLYAADVAPENLLTVPPDELRYAWRRPWIFARWWQQLHARKFDACLVSYDQSSVTHALARLTGGPLRVGAAGTQVRSRHALTHAVPCQASWSVARWNWEMARTLVAAVDGARDWPEEPPAPDLAHFDTGAVTRGHDIIIHAGTNKIQTRWPVDRWAAVAAGLARDHPVVWIDTPETSAVTLPPIVSRRRTPDLAALARMLAATRLLVGNNSGPMHLASALGTPGLIVSGPSAHAWDPAWHREKFRLLRTPGLACLPCEDGPFWPGRCTHDADPLACLYRWTPEAVEHECRAWLARWPASQTVRAPTAQ